jgi:hypothetical protein
MTRSAIHGQLLSFSGDILCSTLVELKLVLQLGSILSTPYQQAIAVCVSADKFFPSIGDIEVLVDLFQEAFDDKSLGPPRCSDILLFIMLGDMNKPPWKLLAPALSDEIQVAQFAQEMEIISCSSTSFKNLCSLQISSTQDTEMRIHGG